MENLTNPGKDPVHGDKIMVRQGELKIYYHYATEGLPTEKENAKTWRDEELGASDWIMSIPDHPQHDAYKTYRTKLRDWPSTENFPDTKPTL